MKKKVKLKTITFEELTNNFCPKYKVKNKNCVNCPFREKYEEDETISICVAKAVILHRDRIVEYEVKE